MSNCCLKALVLSVVSKLLRNFFLKHIFHSHPRGMRSSSSEVRPSHICVSISQVDSNTKSSNHDRAEEIGLSLACTRKISANRGSRMSARSQLMVYFLLGGRGQGEQLFCHLMLSGPTYWVIRPFLEMSKWKKPLSNADSMGVLEVSEAKVWEYLYWRVPGSRILALLIRAFHF